MGRSEITVRYGKVVVHCSIAQLAAVLEQIELLRGTSAGHRQVEEQLKVFPETFREVVAAARDGLEGGPGAALASVRDEIGKPLANEVRSLLRARGASEHPVPAGKCQRVLGSVRKALRGACGHGGSCGDPGGDDGDDHSDVSTVCPYLSMEEAVERYGGDDGTPANFDGDLGAARQRDELGVLQPDVQGVLHDADEQLQPEHVDELVQVRGTGGGPMHTGNEQRVLDESPVYKMVVVGPDGVKHASVVADTTVNEILSCEAGDAQAVFNGVFMRRADKVCEYGIADGSIIDVVCGC